MDFLRHTNATLMLQTGTDFKVTQARLGHADIGTTFNIYSHVNLEMQKKASEKLVEIISSGKIGDKIKITPAEASVIYGVTKSISRVLYLTVIYLGLLSLVGSSDTPEGGTSRSYHLPGKR